MERDEYCVKLARLISDTLEIKIHSTDVSGQLMLIELGQEPTNKMIGSWIKKTATKEKKEA